MADFHGRFLWHELMTSDPEAAKVFYTAVLGWKTRESSVPDMKYTEFLAGDTPVAGLMEIPDMARKAGAPPSWTGYIGADDVDRTAEQVKQRGGTVHMGPSDIPGVGRFAVVSDPQWARFALFKWSDPAMHGTSGQFDPGRVGWNELLAADLARAFDFYNALFGWRKGEALDMGEMGTYQLFAAGEQTLGGMFNKPAVVPTPFWQFYFNAGAIDAAQKRVTGAGGQIAHGPMEVPGGKWILNCIDPQGAMFALLGAKGG